MYTITKNGTLLSTEDKTRYCKYQSNGTWCLCPIGEATGIVVNNTTIEQLADVVVTEINGQAVLAEKDGYTAELEEEVLDLTYELVLTENGLAE